MLDLRQYASLGAALKDALERWPNETCLIEADRDREKVRLTYSDFKEMAQPLCRALEDADFKAGDRAAIIMTNQSKWLISAYAILFCGGVLVPLDLIYLDENYRVIHLVEYFPAFRIAPLRVQAESVLELPTHTIYSSQTQPGDQLVICVAEEMNSRLSHPAVETSSTNSS